MKINIKDIVNKGFINNSIEYILLIDFLSIGKED